MATNRKHQERKKRKEERQKKANKRKVLKADYKRKADKKKVLKAPKGWRMLKKRKVIKANKSGHIKLLKRKNSGLKSQI